jgi:hypothetical protein
MSLTVSAQVFSQAQAGLLTMPDFLAVVEASLPKAWVIVHQTIERKLACGAGNLVEHAPSKMDDETRGQLLRMMASNAIRTAIESRYGVRLAFRNCHAIACFMPGEDKNFELWTSIESQIIHQSPDQVHC